MMSVLGSRSIAPSVSYLYIYPGGPGERFLLFPPSTRSDEASDCELSTVNFCLSPPMWGASGRSRQGDWFTLIGDRHARCCVLARATEVSEDQWSG